MNVVFVEPFFPSNQRHFARALAGAGATVIGIGEYPADALDGELKGWLHHYEQVRSVTDVEAVTAAVRWVQDKLWVDRLEATIEAHTLPAAQVREAAPTRGPDPRAAPICSPAAPAGTSAATGKATAAATTTPATAGASGASPAASAPASTQAADAPPCATARPARARPASSACRIDRIAMCVVHSSAWIITSLCSRLIRSAFARTSAHVPPARSAPSRHAGPAAS